jgi:hypothetical protein
MGATVDRILRDGVPAAKKLGAEWISKADDAHKAANAATALVSGQKEWADSVERARHAAKNMMREVHREFDGLERLAVSSGVDQDGDATRIIDTARNSVEEAGAMVEEPVTETDDVADLSAQWEHAAAQALADTRYLITPPSGLEVFDRKLSFNSPSADSISCFTAAKSNILRTCATIDVPAGNRFCVGVGFFVNKFCIILSQTLIEKNARPFNATGDKIPAAAWSFGDDAIAIRPRLDAIASSDVGTCCMAGNPRHPPH